MNLTSTQIKDTYGNLVTIGSVAGTPTTGTLQNGAGSDVTTLTVAGTLNVTDLNASGTTDLDGAVTINESGADVDFRVEASGVVNALFLDGANGNVGIGTSSPAAVSGGTVLEVSSSTGSEMFVTRADTTLTSGDFIGGFAFKNTDADGTPPHYAGFKAFASSTENGAMDLHFYSARAGYEANASTMIIDSSGNVGIGVTPSTWANLYGIKALDLSSGGAIWGLTTNLELGNNIYYDTTDVYKYKGSAIANTIQFGGNGTVFFNAPSGSAGATATLTERFKVGASETVVNDPQGNHDFRVEGDTDSHLIFADASADGVGIGTTTISEKLNVNGNIGFGNGVSRTVNAANVSASTGTFDITMPANYIGFMAIQNRRFNDSNPGTYRTYSIFGRDTNTSFQQIHEYVDGAGAAFTVTSPSSGVIRITNNYALNSDIEILLQYRSTQTI